MNSASKREKGIKKKGWCFSRGSQREEGAKYPIVRGNHNIGTSSLPQTSWTCKVPIPLRMHAQNPAGEALHSRWGELELPLWRSNSVVFSSFFFSCLFSFSAYVCLSWVSVLRLQTFSQVRLHSSCRSAFQKLTFLHFSMFIFGLVCFPGWCSLRV